MRRRVGAWADRLGIRGQLEHSKQWITDVVAGEKATAVERQNRRDNEHLRLLLSFTLGRNSNCLDVGSNRGMFLEEFLRLAPGGHHIAYEPLPTLSQELKRRFPEVEVRQRALSDAAGQSAFAHVLDPELEPYSGLVRTFHAQSHDFETLVVATERLDDHVPDGWLPHFVKIDVEGAEVAAIEGAMNTLRSARPVIAIEHGWTGQADVDASSHLYDLLCHDLGLRLFDTDGSGPLTLPDFLAELHFRWNWIARD
jgi:FkbM family methyltransferase